MKFKLEWDGEMVDVLLDKLNTDKDSYEMSLSNYTCLIDTKDIVYHFLKHMRKPAVFSIYNELKRYLDTCLDTSIEHIDRDNMRYYSAHLFGKPIYKHKAYNIDINAAYPTCLLINKLIDEKLFNRLMTLNKDERLTSIGMMASRKRIFKVIKGKVFAYIDEESHYSKYFFYCVKTITDIIWRCEIASGMSFIFSWVDGLYTTDKKHAELCRKVIAEAGYKSTVSEITDFQYTPMGESIRITFYKDKENKLFNIPIENNRVAQILKYIHHETLQD